MASTRDIRRRIKSVKNTRQITKAMELVAASKMKKAQQAAVAAHPYAALMARMLAVVGGRIDESAHPFLVKREVKVRGILLVTSDKGLCGPLNSNLFKVVAEIRTPAKFVAIGRKGAQFLARTRRDLLADFPVHDRVPFGEVRAAAEFLVKQYLAGAVDTIEVIYSRFKNTLVQEPVDQPVLPLASLKDFLAQLPGAAGTAEETREMNFEPSVEQVLHALLPFYVNHQVHQFVLSAKASEHSARMVAMKNATDNAKQLIKDLTLEYNKLRQASITKELLEIASAAMALG